MDRRKCCEQESRAIGPIIQKHLDQSSSGHGYRKHRLCFQYGKSRAIHYRHYGGIISMTRNLYQEGIWQNTLKLDLSNARALEYSCGPFPLTPTLSPRRGSHATACPTRSRNDL